MSTASTKDVPDSFSQFSKKSQKYQRLQQKPYNWVYVERANVIFEQMWLLSQVDIFEFLNILLKRDSQDN